MNKLSSFFYIFIFSLFGIVSFQNCNKVQVSDLSSNGANGFDSPVDTPVVMAACNSGNRQKITKSFLFPKPAITCEWEKSGNLAPRNDFFQARIEQNEMLNLPPGSIICDVKFSFEKQQFLYDDHFLISFNDAIIASSYNFDSVLIRKFSLLRYEWAKIAGMNWDNKKEGTFCVSGSNCLWPDTDTAGAISLSYEPIVFQKIMAEDLNRNEHSLKFISIGDNDEKDCEHSDVSFSLDIEYVSKP